MERFETYLQALAEVQYVHVQSMRAFVPTYVRTTYIHENLLTYIHLYLLVVFVCTLL